jgi:hypothetical protein
MFLKLGRTMWIVDGQGYGRPSDDIYISGLRCDAPGVRFFHLRRSS